MKIIYFLGVSRENLRSHFRELARMYHPDLMDGDASVMQVVNEEFQFLMGGGVPSDNTEPKAIRFLGTADGQAVSFGYDTGSLCQTMSEAISFCLGLPDGVEVARVGDWLWVSGQTDPVKDDLLAAGFKWSVKQQMYFWAVDLSTKKPRASKYSFNTIRMKYGEEKVK